MMMMMDIEADQQQQSKQKRPSRKRWTPSLDKLFAACSDGWFENGRCQASITNRINALDETGNVDEGASTFISLS